MSRSRPLLLVLLTLTLAGCGGDDDDEPLELGAETTAPSEPGPEGTRIVARDSDFGRVLFDANDQAIYVFEIDRENQSNCTSAECVEAWPPVLTEGEPAAGEGVDAALLGTIRRDDGSVQVTYNGRPLYFYAHEGPDEIKCHNVDLHGGLWWVVTPEGEPAA